MLIFLTVEGQQTPLTPIKANVSQKLRIMNVV